MGNDASSSCFHATFSLEGLQQTSVVALEVGEYVANFGMEWKTWKLQNSLNTSIESWAMDSHWRCLKKNTGATVAIEELT